MLAVFFWPGRTPSRELLYTDGLIETVNAEDDLFGLERLKATVAAAFVLAPEVLADNLLTAVD